MGRAIKTRRWGPHKHLGLKFGQLLHRYQRTNRSSTSAYAPQGLYYLFNYNQNDFKKTCEIGPRDTLLGMLTRRLKKRQCPVFSKMLELRRNHTWTPKKPSTDDKKQPKSPWKHAKPLLKNLFGASGHRRRPILEASGAKRIIQIIQKQIQRPSCASQKTDQNTCTSSILHIPRRNIPRSLIPYQKHTSQPPCAHGFMH